MGFVGRWLGVAVVLGACACADDGASASSGPGGDPGGRGTGGPPPSAPVSGASARAGAGGASPSAMTSAGSGGMSSGAMTSGASGAPRDAGMSRDAMVSGASGAAADGGSTGGAEDCKGAGLIWKSAQKTNYTSYPDPGSEECVKYNGCMWAGQFAACNGKKTEEWVAMHNIVAAFPDFVSLELHDLCLRSGDKTIVVTVYDTCGDSDCDGCCTENQGGADQLIDLESYTNDRWDVRDGRIEWADLGPTRTSGCD